MKKLFRILRASGLLFLMTLLLVLTGCGAKKAEKPAEEKQTFAAETAELHTEDDSLAEVTQIDVSSDGINKKKKKDKNSGSKVISQASEVTVEEDGTYTGKEEVALYIHTFGKLPSNYISKKEAEKLGWVSREGNLDEVAPGKSIGGSRFGNYEGLLPEKKGRSYTECDIDFDGTYRNSKRIVFSNDGLIFYTEDHYKTFEQLY